ncbi:MAG: putative Ig domain-containing protein [Pirellulaceae bacterium]
MTTSNLQPGQFEDINFPTTLASVSDLWISVDDDGTGAGRVGECDEENNLWHPLVDLTNLNPSLDSTPITVATEGRIYRYAFAASDPDNDPVTFELAAAPQGMQIVGGQIEWTPSSSQSGIQLVQLVARDGSGGAALQSFTIDVAEALNNRPEIVGIPDSLVIEAGRLFEYPIQSIDDDGDMLTYSLLIGPEFMRVNPMLGIVRWIPHQAHLGTHNVVVQVRDSGWRIGTQSFELTVIEPSFSPIFVSQSGTLAVIDATYQYDVEVYDGNSDEEIELAAGSIPSGHSL